MLSQLMFWGTQFGGYYLAFARYPVFVFVVYQSIYFFNPSKRWWGYAIPDLSYSYYSVVLMAFIVFINWKKTSQNKLFEAPPTKWVYLFLFVHLTAYSYAVLPIRHDIFFIYFLKLVVIISIAYKLISNIKDLHIAIMGYVFGAWYLSFYTYQVGRNSGDRVEGIGTVDAQDSNGVAAALAPAIIFGIYYLWRSPDWKLKGVALIALAFTCNALVLINSRGAVLGVVLGAGYFMYHLYKSRIKTRNQKATVVFLCLVGLAGVSVVVDDTFMERFSSLQEETAGVNKEGESGSTRILYWEAAYRLALDYPFGTGIYGFNYHAVNYIDANSHVGRKLRNSGGFKSVHSSWFSTLAEVGFIGLFLLIAIIVSCFRALKKCKTGLLERKSAQDYYLIIAIEGALITYMVAMTFLDRHRAEILYWLILFSMCAYNIYVKKISEIEQQ